MNTPISEARALVLLALLTLTVAGGGCVPVLKHPAREANPALPSSFERNARKTGDKADKADTPASSAATIAGQFFSDPPLRALIKDALARNQELQLSNLEAAVSKSEILEREGEFLPKAELRAGGGLFREGEDTGELEKEDDSVEYGIGVLASWEIDIWRKLRNARDAAAKRYLASVEGRRFIATGVVAEVAGSYYELLALDSKLKLLRRNIKIQTEALAVVRLQKQAGKVSELAVKRFEAEVFKNRSLIALIRQEITQVENRLRFLTGSYGRPIERDAGRFAELRPMRIQAGAPTELLKNRPDIKQAELELAAAKLDVEVARAGFYPSLELKAGFALKNAVEFGTSPEDPVSIAYHLLAEVSQPLWNRRALKARYQAANSRQMQAVVAYERTILKAWFEVLNQLAEVKNLQETYGLRSQEVGRLRDSIVTSMSLFKSARADYMEVLLTRRDSLEAQMELIETKGRQLKATVKLYRALGGGWK